eukprot:2914010-Prymnesium_polylepis.3
MLKRAQPHAQFSRFLKKLFVFAVVRPQQNLEQFGHHVVGHASLSVCGACAAGRPAHVCQVRIEEDVCSSDTLALNVKGLSWLQHFDRNETVRMDQLHPGLPVVELLVCRGGVPGVFSISGRGECDECLALGHGIEHLLRYVTSGIGGCDEKIDAMFRELFLERGPLVSVHLFDTEPHGTKDPNALLVRTSLQEADRSMHRRVEFLERAVAFLDHTKQMLALILARALSSLRMKRQQNGARTAASDPQERVTLEHGPQAVGILWANDGNKQPAARQVDWQAAQGLCKAGLVMLARGIQPDPGRSPVLGLKFVRP